MNPARFPHIPVPRDWPQHVRSAAVHVAAMAHAALVTTRSWCANSPIARVCLVGRLNAVQSELSTIREVKRITDARMARIPPPKRPRYTSTERLAILELRAAQGWSLAETARVFQVEPQTITSWMKALDGENKAGLVELPGPVNRFPDFVAYVVQRLKVICPGMGRKRIAQTLARAGLHLASSTVRRMLKRPPVRRPVRESAPVEAEGRTVTARYPNHVWHVDLTVVPVSGGFWMSWFPFALAQRWPFCWWVMAVEDHFSRAVMGLALFRRMPTSAQVCEAFDRLCRERNVSPKHMISDRGCQFDSQEYRQWCKTRDHPIRPRFGAVGKCGSIAVVERFIRSLKDECTRQIVVPLADEDMRAVLNAYAAWYNEHRPHQGLGGATPLEVYRRAMPAIRRPRFEPRARWPRRSRCARPQTLVKGRPGARVALHVAFAGDRRHLPIVQVTKAA